jgi:hypothetical protein
LNNPRRERTVAGVEVAETLDRYAMTMYEKRYATGAGLRPEQRYFPAVVARER